MSAPAADAPGPKPVATISVIAGNAAAAALRLRTLVDRPVAGPAGHPAFGPSSHLRRMARDAARSLRQPYSGRVKASGISEAVPLGGDDLRCSVVVGLDETKLVFPSSAQPHWSHAVSVRTSCDPHLGGDLVKLAVHAMAEDPPRSGDAPARDALLSAVETIRAGVAAAFDRLDDDVQRAAADEARAEMRSAAAACGAVVRTLSPAPLLRMRIGQNPAMAEAWIVHPNGGHARVRLPMKDATSRIDAHPNVALADLTTRHAMDPHGMPVRTLRTILDVELRLEDAEIETDPVRDALLIRQLGTDVETVGAAIRTALAPTAWQRDA